MLLCELLYKINEGVRIEIIDLDDITLFDNNGYRIIPEDWDDWKVIDFAIYDGHIEIWIKEPEY